MTDLRSRLKGWAPLFDLVASMAVVVSLVFLSLEVRQNTRAIEGAAFQELIHASDASLLAVATDSSLAAIWLRGADFESSSVVEQRRYFALTRVFWRNFENAFLQYNRGLIGEEEWGIYRTMACHSELSTWYLHRAAMTPAFVEVVDTCLGASEPSDP